MADNVSRGLARHAAKRDKNEAEIVSALERTGWIVRRLSDKGIPDLLCIRGKQVMLLEVKMPGAKLNDEQSGFFKLVQGAPVWVAYSIKEALGFAARGEFYADHC